MGKTAPAFSGVFGDAGEASLPGGKEGHQQVGFAVIAHRQDNGRGLGLAHVVSLSGRPVAAIIRHGRGAQITGDQYLSVLLMMESNSISQVSHQVLMGAEKRFELKMCYLGPRTFVTHLPGPHTPPEGERG